MSGTEGKEGGKEAKIFYISCPTRASLFLPTDYLVRYDGHRRENGSTVEGISWRKNSRDDIPGLIVHKNV